MINVLNSSLLPQTIILQFEIMHLSLLSIVLSYSFYPIDYIMFDALFSCDTVSGKIIKASLRINPKQPNINLGKQSFNENAFSLTNKRIYLHNKLKFESNFEHVKAF